MVDKNHRGTEHPFGRLGLATGLTLLIMYVVPFPIYGALSMITDLEPPGDDSVGRFMLSVLVVKAGVAIAFVILLYMARSIYLERWVHYATIWWVMFAIIELGQAMTAQYSWLDAIGGIVSEAIYFPLAAYAVRRCLTLRPTDRSTELSQH